MRDWNDVLTRDGELFDWTRGPRLDAYGKCGGPRNSPDYYVRNALRQLANAYPIWRQPVTNVIVRDHFDAATLGMYVGMDEMEVFLSGELAVYDSERPSMVDDEYEWHLRHYCYRLLGMWYMWVVMERFLGIGSWIVGRDGSIVSTPLFDALVAPGPDAFVEYLLGVDMVNSEYGSRTFTEENYFTYGDMREVLPRMMQSIDLRINARIQQDGMEVLADVNMREVGLMYDGLIDYVMMDLVPYVEDAVPDSSPYPLPLTRKSDDVVLKNAYYGIILEAKIAYRWSRREFMNAFVNGLMLDIPAAILTTLMVANREELQRFNLPNLIVLPCVAADNRLMQRLLNALDMQIAAFVGQSTNIQVPSALYRILRADTDDVINEWDDCLYAVPRGREDWSVEGGSELPL